MIGLIQRVTSASVAVNGETIGEIERGLLVLVGIEKGDADQQVARLLERLLGYRVFPDDTGRMNASLKDISGGLLLVPQFTLAADTHKGMRPSFASAAEPAAAKALFTDLVAAAKEAWPQTASGQFGADMQVSLVNDGPVTFWLQAS